MIEASELEWPEVEFETLKALLRTLQEEQSALFDQRSAAGAAVAETNSNAAEDVGDRAATAATGNAGGAAATEGKAKSKASKAERAKAKARSKQAKLMARFQQQQTHFSTSSLQSDLVRKLRERTFYQGTMSSLTFVSLFIFARTTRAKPRPPPLRVKLRRCRASVRITIQT